MCCFYAPPEKMKPSPSEEWKLTLSVIKTLVQCKARPMVTLVLFCYILELHVKVSSIPFLPTTCIKKFLYLDQFPLRPLCLHRFSQSFSRASCTGPVEFLSDFFPFPRSFCPKFAISDTTLAAMSWRHSPPRPVSREKTGNSGFSCRQRGT